MHGREAWAGKGREKEGRESKREGEEGGRVGELPSVVSVSLALHYNLAHISPSNRSQLVKVGQATSSVTHCIPGVSQGSVLGTCVFS